MAVTTKSEQEAKWEKQKALMDAKYNELFKPFGVYGLQATKGNSLRIFLEDPHRVTLSMVVKNEESPAIAKRLIDTIDRFWVETKYGPMDPKKPNEVFAAKLEKMQYDGKTSILTLEIGWNTKEFADPSKKLDIRPKKVE
jgi:hypothetical protein